VVPSFGNPEVVVCVFIIGRRNKNVDAYNQVRRFPFLYADRMHRMRVVGEVSGIG
jgi:hypothetical protein